MGRRPSQTETDDHVNVAHWLLSPRKSQSKGPSACVLTFLPCNVNANRRTRTVLFQYSTRARIGSTGSPRQPCTGSTAVEPQTLRWRYDLSFVIISSRTAVDCSFFLGQAGESEDTFDKADAAAAGYRPPRPINTLQSLHSPSYKARLRSTVILAQSCM